MDLETIKDILAEGKPIEDISSDVNFEGNYKGTFTVDAIEEYYAGLWGQSQEQVDRILSQVGTTKEFNAIVKYGKITFFSSEDEPWDVYFDLTIENAKIVSAVSSQEVKMINISSGSENGKILIEGVMQLY